MDLETSEAIEGVRFDVGALRQELHDGLAENRRHFEVIVESLRDDIRMIAEGLVALDRKVEGLRPPGYSQ